MPGSYRKEMKQVHARLVAQGCVVTYRGSGHYAVVTPDGLTVFHSSTPRTGRWLAKLRSKMRQSGISL